MILALDGGAWVLYSLRSTRLHVDLSGVLAGATSESEPCVALLTAIAQPMAGVVISGGVQSIRPEGCSSTFPSWQGLSADHQPILGANCIRLPLTSELNCITHPATARVRRLTQLLRSFFILSPGDWSAHRRCSHPSNSWGFFTFQCNSMSRV